MTLDFAILNSYAVPYLKHGIATEEKNAGGQDIARRLMPFRPDGFPSKSSIGKVRDSSIHFKVEIAKSIRLSSFSFFEAYVGDVIREVLEFHGAERLSDALVVDQDLGYLSSSHVKFHTQLREPPSKSKVQKYRKRILELQLQGVRFPNQALLRTGMRRMKHLAASYRAADIPSVLSEALGFELTAKQRGEFHEAREARNRIAHGKASQADCNLRLAVRANYSLRELALALDRHVLRHWMVVDPITLEYAAK